MSTHEDDADKYAMYRGLGRFKAAELAEGMARLHALLTGMTEGFEAARGDHPRPVDDTRLPFDVARECAWAEYLARVEYDSWRARAASLREQRNDAIAERDEFREIGLTRGREIDRLRNEMRDMIAEREAAIGTREALEAESAELRADVAKEHAAREREYTNGLKLQTLRTRDLRHALGVDSNDWSHLVEEVAALKAREAESEPATVVKALTRRVRILEADLTAAREGAASADMAREVMTRDRDDLGIRLARLQSLVRTMLDEVDVLAVSQTIVDGWYDRLTRSTVAGSGRSPE